MTKFAVFSSYLLLTLALASPRLQGQEEQDTTQAKVLQQRMIKLMHEVNLARAHRDSVEQKMDQLLWDELYLSRAADTSEFVRRILAAEMSSTYWTPWDKQGRLQIFLYLDSTADTSAVKAAIVSHGGLMQRAYPEGPNVCMILCYLGPEQARAIAQLPHVVHLELIGPPKPRNALQE